MIKDVSRSRRNFLVKTAATAAGLTLGPIASKSRVFSKTTGWINGVTKINPNIDNLRVVYIKDDAMVSSNPTKWDIQSANDPVIASVVEADMDKMAMALAQKANATEAWATIFRKPDSKQWNQVKAAIKVNTINYSNCPRLAVIGKLCKVLINLGVLPANIYIYDACTSPVNAYNTTYGKSKLPEGVVITGDLGGRVNVTIPCDNPLKLANHPTSHTFPCCGYLVDGTIDILINLAVNKGHGQTDKGGETLCQKNHTGSIKFSCPSLDEMIAENKCDPIIGTQSAGLPYRQQLCVVDAIYSSVNGPGGNPDKMTHALVMGTFAGAVDYLTCKKIREEIMGASHVESALNTHITGYGYTEQDRIDLLTKSPEQNNSKGWVNAATWAASINKKLINDKNNVQKFSLIVNNNLKSNIQLFIPSNKRIFKAMIFDLKGNFIENLIVKNDNIYWNTRTGNGVYVIKLIGETGILYSEKISVF